ncbi:hypothetical protein A2448_00720 [Candidatus Peregrinibacteria bacterium RIFOXYC2_FULL_41_22]|nr:MAG: hypothetical protein A2448_00720 [Candidatus Peregrinibacteria bacterium RIFOXYC2_FULL_41_22]
MTDPKQKFSFKQIAGKIESKEEAVKIIKDCSNAFFILAGIEIVAGIVIIGTAAIIDGIIFGILAFVLRKFYSRVAAIILLLMSLGSVIVTVMNNASGGNGGSNIILAIVIVYASARGIQATFKYNEKTDTKVKI